MILIIKLIRKKKQLHFMIQIWIILTYLLVWETETHQTVHLLFCFQPTNESLQRSKQIKNIKITEQWQLTQNKLKNKKLRKSITLLLLSKTLTMAMSEVKKEKKSNHDVKLNDPFNKINRKW